MPDKEYRTGKALSEAVSEVSREYGHSGTTAISGSQCRGTVVCVVDLNEPTSFQCRDLDFFHLRIIDH